MMPLGKLARLVGRNTVRSPKHFALSAFGIVVGIASFVFFLALSMGVRNVVLGEIFPLERVEVVAPKVSFAGIDASKKIDQAVVDEIAAQKWVAEVVPRMTLLFPAAGVGWIGEQRIPFEVGGFADGIDGSFVAGDKEWSPIFRDWETEEDKAQQIACNPDKKCPNPDRYYCDAVDNKCHHRVPAIISPTLLEIYNSQYAKSHGMPQIDKSLQKFILERGGLGAMRFYVTLGDSMVPGASSIPPWKQRRVEGVLIGISEKAMPIGITVPIQYVERWNREFAGEEAATSYSSVVVSLKDKDGVAPFSHWLKTQMELELRDSMGERFATAIFIVTSLFVLISLVIVTISAINIAHNFFMQVSERRRELGILRAVGATRTDVRSMILGEAAVIGLIGGVIGIALAVTAGYAIDAASAAWLPQFPFKPETYFDFRPWILGSGVLFSVLFCVIGGFLPARRAARMEPAQALTQQ